MAAVANTKIILTSDSAGAQKSFRTTNKILKLTEREAKQAGLALRRMNVTASQTQGVQKAAIAFDRLAASHARVAFLSNPAAQAAAFGTMVKGMNNMGRSAAAATVKVTSLQKAMVVLNSTVGKLGLAFGGAALLGGVVRFGTSSVRAFAEAEAAMGPVLTLAEFTTEQIHEMEESTIQLRRAFGATAREVESARFDVISSGFKEVNNQTKIIEASFKLAKTATADFSETTKILTQTMAALKLPVSETAVVMDQLKAIADNSKNTLAELGPAIATAAPAAKAIGKSLVELGAGLDVLTLSGIDAAEAGTLLSSSFIQLIKPETLKRIKEAGLNLDFAKLQTMDLVDVIQTLPIDQADKLFEILGRAQAFRGVSTLANNMDLLKEKLDAVANSAGLVERELAEAMDKTQVKLDRLGASWDIFKEKIGKAFVGQSQMFDSMATAIDFIADKFLVFTNLWAAFADLLTFDIVGAILNVGEAIAEAFQIEKLGEIIGAIREGEWKEAGKLAAGLFEKGVDENTSDDPIRFDLSRFRPEGTLPGIATPLDPVKLTDAQREANIRLLELRGKDLAAFKANLDNELRLAKDAGAEQTTLSKIRSLEIARFRKEAADKERADTQQLQIELAGFEGNRLLAFTLALNKKSNALREAGADELRVANAVQQAQTDFAISELERRKAEEERMREERKQAFLDEANFMQEALVNFIERFQTARDVLVAGATEMLNAFGGALAGAITQVFEALGRGEKINFKKLVGGILTSIGTAAIATGTFAILAGAIATIAPGIGAAAGIAPGTGPAVAAAGAALVAFGGGLVATGAALSKSGGAAAGAGGGQGAAQTSGFGQNVGEGARGQRPGGNITFNITGILSDSDLADTLENEIMPKMEEITGRGASRFVLNEG